MFTVQELVEQGYTVEHARQYVNREAVRVKNEKASGKQRRQAKAALPKAVSAVSVKDHNTTVLEATAEEAKRRFVMTPARQAALDKAHAARSAKAAARRNGNQG